MALNEIAFIIAHKEIMKQFCLELSRCSGRVAVAVPCHDAAPPPPSGLGA